MNVAELLEILSKIDGNANVFVKGPYDHACPNVEVVHTIRDQLPANVTFSGFYLTNKDN